jgi:hypothetical protein
MNKYLYGQNKFVEGCWLCEVELLRSCRIPKEIKTKNSVPLRLCVSVFT